MYNQQVSPAAKKRQTLQITDQGGQTHCAHERDLDVDCQNLEGVVNTKSVTDKHKFSEENTWRSQSPLFLVITV